MTPAEARDAILTAVVDAWAANVDTAGRPLLFAGVAKPGKPASGVWGRAAMRHLGAEENTQGSPGVRRDQHEGVLKLYAYAPIGDGGKLATQIAGALRLAFTRQRFGTGGWFYEVRLDDAPEEEGPWDGAAVIARFRYPETV